MYSEFGDLIGAALAQNLSGVLTRPFPRGVKGGKGSGSRETHWVGLKIPKNNFRPGGVAY